MPELPEVETVKTVLKNRIQGLMIRDIDVHYERMMDEDTRSALIGQTILDITRFGKYICFMLTDVILISHLRMEGRYFFKTEDEPLLKHEHIVFHLSDGLSLRYHDTRKFGTFDLRTYQNYLSTKPLNQLGKEPFDIDPKAFYEALKKKHISIKTALLDQTLIAGIGNIYADEILARVSIIPHRYTDEITLKEAKEIVFAGIDILNAAIASGGTTIRTYVSQLGVSGRFQLKLKVHQREAEPCDTCGRPIVRTVINGRSSFYCTKCQKR
ncbi:DNA-formamidopyrimidine glycosylase [Acholeplasma vituli]|uniref:Formamidopyrimidine-DNA glycosylase n=1 Tax=Paracholeplasma vituli TaxID=69473 RepID=A0ABT2PYF5_9MOLU|nr:DNA-formamidopyrimidine glycosylase [Paracholeplasma vituli]MCU0104767.1 DNA-formamidopyrimidine glycosylase [Paracholeplasma vituli]